jgi:hypothetical protein
MRNNWLASSSQLFLEQIYSKVYGESTRGDRACNQEGGHSATVAEEVEDGGEDGRGVMLCGLCVLRISLRV